MTGGGQGVAVLLHHAVLGGAVCVVCVKFKPTVKQWFGIALAALAWCCGLSLAGFEQYGKYALAIGGGAAWGAGTVLSMDVSALFIQPFKLYRLANAAGVFGFVRCGMGNTQ